MTSWIISIDKDHPQHWDYAKRDKAWDLRTRREIRRGDTVYFWQATQGLAGRGLVAADVRDSPTTGLPWDDGGTTRYNGRIDFAWLQDYEGAGLTWSEVQGRTGIAGGPNIVPRTSDSAIERRLADLFGEQRESDASDLPSSEAAAIAALVAPDVSDLATDRRERTLAAIRLRQGQPAFRQKLLNAYGGRCAVTGATTPQVLEAAHIMPYMGGHTNVVQNGLLLRSDIHTLFDRLLLTVRISGSEAITRVAPDIRDATYRELDGQPLRNLPADHRDLPSPSYLQQHAAQCSWL